MTEYPHLEEIRAALGDIGVELVALADVTKQPEMDSKLLLCRVERLVRDADRLKRTAVAQARREGVSWGEIGVYLGVSRQTVWERYSDHASVTDSLANAAGPTLFDD